MKLCWEGIKNQIKFLIFGLTVAQSSCTLIIREIYPKTMDSIILDDYMDDMLLKAQPEELLHFH